MKNRYNVLIVGAGNIGAFFDMPSSENILTHAHAFSKLDGFNLLGFVDLDKNRVEKAARLWGTASFESIEEASRMYTIDIVCVCVPDQYHYEILKKILNSQVKLVFVEKPLAKTLEEAEDIIKVYKQRGVKCLVNYSRRFVPEFKRIRNEFLAGDYGKFICGNGYYGKGTLHNGSHLIDFLRYIIGEINSTETFDYNYDFYTDDPSVSAVLSFENGGKFIMMNMPCDMYTIFELELLFQKKKIRIIDSGFRIEIYDVVDSDIFKGYKNLVKKEEYNSALGNAIENAAFNILNCLNSGEELNCTLEDGYTVMEICKELKSGIINE